MLSVIVPTYNERGNITTLIERVMQAFDQMPEPAELLIVDDASPDGTADVARERIEQSRWQDRARVIVRDSDRGLAKAVVAGFEAAGGDVLAVMDADLSHPAELLPELLRALREQGAEVAVASRYVGDGGVENWPLLRQIISRGACLLARPLVGVRDNTSGFFMLDRNQLDGSELKPRGYKILLELLVRTRARKVVEVPFVFRDRTAGESKLGGAVMLAYLFQLAALYRWRHPMFIGYLQFGLVGLLGMAIDATVFALAYWYLGLAELGASAGGFLAQSISFLAAAWFNFLVNAQWTFRERRASARWWVFLAVSVVGFVLRSLVFEALVATPALEPAAGVLHLPMESLALFCAIMVASVWNYLGSRNWAFPETAGDGIEGIAPRDQAIRGWLSLALLGALSLKLVFAAATGLAADEAYYWQWSRNLAWGYHDHPPMIAYIIGAGTRLLGHTELGVRLFPVLGSVALAFMVYRLGRDYSRSREAGLWAALALLVTPLYAIGGPLATPDAPLLFFWLATLTLVVEALRHGGRRYWLLAGLALGLGMISKYAMVLLALSLLATMLILPRGRAALRQPAPWIGIGVAVAICIPMLIWNLRRGMASVEFQLRHGLDGTHGGTQDDQPLLQLVEFLAGQALIVTPLLFGLMLWAAWTLIRRGKAPQQTASNKLSPSEWHCLLLIPAGLTLLVFSLASLAAASEVNWGAPAYLSLMVFAGAGISRLLQRRRRRLQLLVAATLLLPASFSTYFNLEAAFPMVAYSSGPFDKLRDREPLARWADELRSDPDLTATPVLASDYKLASLLAFYLADRPATQAPLETGSGSAYHEWMRPRCDDGSGWYFTSRRNDPRLGELFEQQRLIDQFEDRRLDSRLATIYAHFGRLNTERLCRSARLGP